MSNSTFEKILIAAAECGEAVREAKATQAICEQQKKELIERITCFTDTHNASVLQLQRAIENIEKMDLVKKSDFEKQKKITSTALRQLESSITGANTAKSLNSVDYTIVALVSSSCALAVSLLVG